MQQNRPYGPFLFRQPVGLGSSDRLNVDFLALLADSAAAARVVAAPPQGATVEPVLELLAVLGFPCFDGQAVLLLDLVAIPFWDDIKGTKWYDPQIRREVVDVAALETLLVLIVFVLKMHHSYEHALCVEVP